jgi:hypothetical protein
MFMPVLASNQRCYGGTVMQVDGSTYSQLVVDGHRIRCSGQSSYLPVR